MNQVSVKVKVAQSCLTLCNPMDYTVHGILQARILEWVAFPSPGDLPNPEIEPRSPTVPADPLPTELSGKPKNTGVGSLSLIQQIFPPQELNRGLPHCRQILYQLSYQGRLVFIPQITMPVDFSYYHIICSLFLNRLSKERTSQDPASMIKLFSNKLCLSNVDICSNVPFKSNKEKKILKFSTQFILLPIGMLKSDRNSENLKQDKTFQNHCIRKLRYTSYLNRAF